MEAVAKETLRQRGYQFILDDKGAIKTVGKGSFGVATLVEDKDGQVFVSKEMNMSQMSRKDRKGVDNEVEMMEQIDHPFIVKFVESFCDANNQLRFIIMEFADGGDLEGRVRAAQRKKEPFAEEQIMAWFVQLCLALAYLHGKRILHRDLKLMNVFLTANATVKLGDFGFSKRLQTHRMAHTVCGTPYYFSPELCQGLAYSNKSDVWSLGVMLYELAMLKRPYEANSMQSLMKKIVYGDFSPPGPDLPPVLRKLIGMLLRKKDTLRPSVAKILAEADIQRYIDRVPSQLVVTTKQERYPLAVTVSKQQKESGEAVVAGTAGSGGGQSLPLTTMSEADEKKASILAKINQQKALRDQHGTGASTTTPTNNVVDSGDSQQPPNKADSTTGMQPTNNTPHSTPQQGLIPLLPTPSNEGLLGISNSSSPPLTPHPITPRLLKEQQQPQAVTRQEMDALAGQLTDIAMKEMKQDYEEEDGEDDKYSMIFESEGEENYDDDFEDFESGSEQDDAKEASKSGQSGSISGDDGR